MYMCITTIHVHVHCTLLYTNLLHLHQIVCASFDLSLSPSLTTPPSSVLSLLSLSLSLSLSPSLSLSHQRLQKLLAVFSILER